MRPESPFWSGPRQRRFGFARVAPNTQKPKRHWRGAPQDARKSAQRWATGATENLATYAIDFQDNLAMYGDAGGRIVAQGTPEVVARSAGSFTGHYLSRILNGNVA